MIPAKDINDVFPKFVPDQLLTSTDLNNLFNYLDEQQRMTRTNLIGIGIVCGLEVSKNSSGSSIIITKGCGVTSEGYIVAIEETIYTQFTVFNALQPRFYSGRFVDDTVSPAVQKFDLWELHQEAVVADSPGAPVPQPLEDISLDDKVVLLFVELLEANNKNCDPDNCDDKGINVKVTFRPLLIRKQDAGELNIISTDYVTAATFEVLKTIKMRRWNIPNTQPVTTEDIINSYKSILSPGFILNVKEDLTDAYNRFSVIIGTEFPSNPFVNLHNTFAFLSGSMSTAQLIHMQYYYDFFSDMLLAYDEFRQKGMAVLSACCPDASLFPRHLLLGELEPEPDVILLTYRNYFIYSPLFDKKEMLEELKSLFRRLTLLLDNLQIPPSGTDIKITPGEGGNIPLSGKTIPYYYRPLPLYQSWNFEKYSHGKANENLSYNASLYNVPATYENDHIINPLLYDLEPYNFLRVEGHIGKDYKTSLAKIQSEIVAKRLPFEVIALRTGDSTTGLKTVDDEGCDYNLEISYDIARREWEAVIGKTIEYLDDVWKNAIRIVNEARLRTFKIQLHKAKPFMVDDLPTFIGAYQDFMPIYEDIEARATGLRNEASTRMDDARVDKDLAEDLIDHFDDVIFSCKKGAFRALFQAYEGRTPEMLAKMLFYNYARNNPCLQHKAGVPMGGTFVLVYHFNDDDETPPSGPFVITGFVIDSEGVELPGVPVQIVGTTIATVTNAAGAFTITTQTLPVTLKANLFGVGTGEVVITSKTGLQVTIVVQNNNNSNAFANSAFDNIKNNIVIADFYLPYICCSDCAPVQIVIQEIPPEEPETATCALLKDIVDEFDGFQQKYDESAGRFREFFGEYDKIIAYFKELSLHVEDSIEDQISFFISSNVVDNLRNWLEGLTGVIMNRDLPELREMALALFRILSELSMYIACIQEDDIITEREGAISMVGILGNISEDLRKMLELKDNLTDSQNDELAALRTEVEREIKKINDNGEQQSKAIYLEFLTKILETLNEFNIE